MDIVLLRRKNLRTAIDAAIATGKFSNDAEFANHFEINPSQISQLVKGHGSFGERAARNLEKKVGWEAGFLDRDVPEQTISKEAVESSNVTFLNKQLRTIPLLDYVQAGLFHEVGYDGINPIGASWTTYESQRPECVFALKVEGYSMSPEFMPGDELVVDGSLEARPGTLVIAQEVKHGVASTTFKKYRVIGVNEFGVDIIELVPLNPDYPILNSTQINISIIGVVVAHNRKFKY
jgi:SOS-response transcriptional repressor LexA